MYQLIGALALLKYFGGLAAAIAVAWGLFSGADSFTEWMRCISISMAGTGGVAYGLGQTKCFPWICRLPLLRSVFPDIDGEWVGVTRSNWKRIESRGNEPLPDLLDVQAEVKIKARLFSITMDLVSENQYSDSTTLAVRIIKEENGEAKLAYIYSNRTKNPKPTDEQQHYGAAILDIKRKNDFIALDGLYWTNRNWTKALNTAGLVLLKRKRSKP
jgi:hypothetical protein